MPQPLTYVRPVYTEEQHFTELLPRWVRRLLIGIAVLGVLWMAVTAALVGSGILSRIAGIGSAASGLGLLTPFLFTGATVLTVVEPDRLRIRVYLLGLGLIRKDLPLAEVLSCDVVRPRDGSDTFGLTRQIALFNRTPGQLSVMVTGNPAVVLRTGRFNRLVLGSRTPDALAEAIRSGMTPPAPSPHNTP